MITYHLPVKFFFNSLDYAWDRKGILFLAVQTNDPNHVQGCAVFKQQANGSFAEVLATGPDGYGPPKMKMKFDGTGHLMACAQNLAVNEWVIPEWSATP
jgi:hypothetical protein